MSETQENGSELERRAKLAKSAMNSAWVAGIVIAIIATIALAATKLL